MEKNQKGRPSYLSPRNEPKRDEISNLYDAAAMGRIDLVKSFLNEGVDVDSMDCMMNERTPLWVASLNGHLDVVDHLADVKADINFKDQDGVTPIHAACRNGHIRVVSLLAELNATLTDQDQNGHTPLRTAAALGYSSVVKLLVEMARREISDMLNIPDNDGVTPLRAASLRGHLKVCRMLVASKADVNKADKNGCTPLWIASCYGHVEICKLLLRWKARVNTPHVSTGATPLIIAAKNGHKKVVEVLLQHRARVNDFDKEVPVCQMQKTALHMATYHGHEDIAVLLISNNARYDEHMKDHFGKTPLEYITDDDFRDVVTEAMEYRNQALIAEHGWSETQSVLEEYFNDVDDLPPDGKAKHKPKRNVLEMLAHDSSILDGVDENRPFFCDDDLEPSGDSADLPPVIKQRWNLSDSHEDWFSPEHSHMSRQFGLMKECGDAVRSRLAHWLTTSIGLHEEEGMSVAKRFLIINISDKATAIQVLRKNPALILSLGLTEKEQRRFVRQLLKDEEMQRRRSSKPQPGPPTSNPSSRTSALQGFVGSESSKNGMTDSSGHSKRSSGDPDSPARVSNRMRNSPLLVHTKYSTLDNQNSSINYMNYGNDSFLPVPPLSPSNQHFQPRLMLELLDASHDDDKSSTHTLLYNKLNNGQTAFDKGLLRVLTTGAVIPVLIQFSEDVHNLQAECMLFKDLHPTGKFVEAYDVLNYKSFHTSTKFVLNDLCKDIYALPIQSGDILLSEYIKLYRSQLTMHQLIHLANEILDVVYALHCSGYAWLNIDMSCFVVMDKRELFPSLQGYNIQNSCLVSKSFTPSQLCMYTDQNGHIINHLSPEIARYIRYHNDTDSIQFDFPLYNVDIWCLGITFMQLFHPNSETLYTTHFSDQSIYDDTVLEFISCLDIKSVYGYISYHFPGTHNYEIRRLLKDMLTFDPRRRPSIKVLKSLPVLKIDVPLYAGIK